MLTRGFLIASLCILATRSSVFVHSSDPALDNSGGDSKPKENGQRTVKVDRAAEEKLRANGYTILTADGPEGTNRTENDPKNLLVLKADQDYLLVLLIDRVKYLELKHNNTTVWKNLNLLGDEYLKAFEYNGKDKVVAWYNGASGLIYKTLETQEQSTTPEENKTTPSTPKTESTPANQGSTETDGSTPSTPANGGGSTPDPNKTESTPSTPSTPKTESTPDPNKTESTPSTPSTPKTESTPDPNKSGSTPTTPANGGGSDSQSGGQGGSTPTTPTTPSTQTVDKKNNPPEGVKLYLDKEKTTDNYEYSEQGKTKTYTAKDGFGFNRVWLLENWIHVGRQDRKIWDATNPKDHKEYANKVIMVDRGSGKRTVTINFFNGETVSYYRSRWGGPWSTKVPDAYQNKS